MTVHQPPDNNALTDGMAHSMNGTPTTNGGAVEETNGGRPRAESSETNEPPAPPQDKLIVGVDFGTTYSGVAAAYSATPDDIDIIKTWPGGNGITSDKVPTEIAYDPAPPPPTELSPVSPVDGGAAKPVGIRWGFQFKPEETRLRCIKLFLDRNQKLPHFVSPLETAAQLRKCERTVMDAVSDYLTKIYEHTMETLYRRYGESFVNSTKVEFVLTVPAVWSDAAKNATLQAAERAGMGNRHELKLISEPEAAAVYTLRTIQPSRLKVGDNYIVCDAGGGTVDLIAYKVTQLNPLRVEESAVGTGGLCGSAFLNYRFQDHVKSRIGAERYESMREKKPKTWQMGLRYFEEFVKRNFNEEEHSEVNVPFPGLPDDEEAGLDSGFLILSAEQVKEIFEPVLAHVIELVEGQVEAIRGKSGIVSGIILVGGFGQSNYLYTRLKRHFNPPSLPQTSSSTSPSAPPPPPPPYTEQPTHEAAAADALPHHQQQQQSIEVLQPLHAWTAVVRGAVLRGMEGSMVEKRRSRWHYGTSYATVFDERKHPVEDRYWSPLWERWMVSDRMQWHIAKGTPISADHPISFHYTRNFRPSQSLIIEDELIACASDTAPDSFTVGRGGGGGDGDGDGGDSPPSLIKVCTLTTDINSVPKSLFTRLTTTKGVEFENLDFELHMRIQSAGLVFELRVDGVRYGSVRAEFN